MASIAYPPPEFNHPFAGPVIERRLSLNELDRTCAPFGHEQGITLYGCAYHLAGRCYIDIPKNISPAFQKQLRAHELGHCNGWRHE
jgi:hypothetical protein